MSENLIWAHTDEDPDNEYGNSMTIAELRKKVVQDKAKFLENLKYWTYMTDLQVLQHKSPLYDVYLEDLSDRPAYLDLILQIHSKQWMTIEAFAEFMTATRYLLSDKLHI